MGFETSGRASGLAKKVSSREALSKVHWLEGRLEFRQKVGVMVGLSGLWCSCTMSFHPLLVRLVILAKSAGSWLKSPSINMGCWSRVIVYSRIWFIAVMFLVRSAATELDVEKP